MVAEGVDILPTAAPVGLGDRSAQAEADGNPDGLTIQVKTEA